MKLMLLIFLFPFITQAKNSSCNVTEYYNEINNQTGYELKTSLANLLKRTHKTLSYGGLLKAFTKTDLDLDFDGDSTIMDMYSENPKTTDPYCYKAGRKTCGKYSREGDCYNREHLFPQGIFNKKRPMKTDIFHVYPTDGIVNNKRDSYPFGKVTQVIWQSQNGSKLGYSKMNNYSGLVFEPIDEFKGDIARAMLYFAVRYEKEIPRFKLNDMTDGSTNQTYQKWFLKILLNWHKQDPVSSYEKRRNDKACKYQHNRNPFIDHPSWVNLIWN